MINIPDVVCCSHITTNPGSVEHTRLSRWHSTTLLYIYFCFHDYCVVVYIIVFPFKTLKQSLLYRSAGLLWVTCVGVVGHQLQLNSKCLIISLLIYVIMLPFIL